MSLSITTEGEIGINGYRYNLQGKINQRIIQKQITKVNTGSDSYDKEAILSNWIFTDGRGGGGIDEMDESIHADRYWWTNCIVSYDGHVFLPRLATALTNNTTAPTITNADMELTTGWTGGARTDAYKHAGTYSWLLNNDEAYQDLTGYVKGGTYTFKCWVGSGAGTGRVNIDDGVTTTNGSFAAGAGWEQITVTKTISLVATKLRVIMDCNAVDDVYFDDATLTFDDTFGTPGSFCNFNGECYKAFGSILAKVNRSTGKMDPVAVFNGQTITALIASLNSRLYIYLGDSTNYYYMSTAEAFTQSNSANAYWGIQWGDLLWKMNSSGVFSSSSDPDGAAPTWANEGDITDIASQIETLFFGPDADGYNQMYCATNSILKIYNDTTNKWLDTQVKLPSHPNGGKGAIYWNDAIYLSYGLGVKKYVTGSTGSLSEIGLDRDGGLPSEYNGEIVKFCADSQFVMFALVDASQSTGTGQSGLYAWDGRSLQCWWADSNNDAAMYDIIVSSTGSGYAVYWDCGGAVYYIDLPRGIGNPKYYSPSYATSGIFISPWFDAGTPAMEKMIKRLRTYAKGITTTETVAIKYRTNKTYTDRDTGWTTLETLNTTGENGENVEVFASGVGEEFGTIQFRLDFARGSTATLSPDILSVVLSYKLQTASTNLKEWDFTVLIDGDCDHADEKQQYERLNTAVNTDTLIALNIFGDDTAEPHYVMLIQPGSSIGSGRNYEGTMSLMAIEV